jgi:hypothetical protein
MLGKGVLSPEMAAGAQSGLERGIEELRQKYAAIEAQKAAAAAEHAAAERAAFRASAAGRAAEEAARVDMRMDDPEVERLRQARLAALKRQSEERLLGQQEGRGELREVAEDEFLREVTSARRVVAHFYHDEFMTCKVMDKHLRALAPRCLAAKLVRVNAQKAPFFVAKLKVRVLPSLVFFVDGVCVGRQTGFEGLVRDARDEDFPTLRLLAVLKFAGMLGEDAQRDAAAEDEEDEEDGEGEGRGKSSKGRGSVSDGPSRGGNFESRLADARRAMLESLGDSDDLDGAA